MTDRPPPPPPFRDGNAVPDHTRPSVAVISLPVVCACPLEYSTREYGRNTITYRTHRDDCRLAAYIAERDHCT